MEWYTLFVKTGDEDIVQQYLSYRFDKSECHAVIPKSKLTEKRKGKYYEVTKPLFPGYILINATMNNNLYYVIKQIPKVYRILHQSEEYYTRIDDEEMKPILKLIDENSVIDYSKIFIENSRVYVNAGPLKGLEGLIRKVDKRKGRARISLDFLGSPREIDLGVHILSRVE